VQKIPSKKTMEKTMEKMMKNQKRKKYHRFKYSKGAKKVTLLEGNEKGNEKGNIPNVKKRLHFESVTKSVTNNVTFQM